MENCSVDTSFIGYIVLIIFVLVGFCIYKYWDNHPLEDQKSHRIGAWIAGIIWIYIGANSVIEETVASLVC